MNRRPCSHRTASALFATFVALTLLAPHAAHATSPRTLRDARRAGHTPMLQPLPTSAPVAPQPQPPALSRPHDLRAPAGWESGEPRFAPAPDGGVLMSWIEPRSKGGEALQFASVKDGHWSNPILIAQGDSLFVNRADLPAVCAFGRSGLAAAWGSRGASPETHQLHLALSFDGGRTWGKRALLHSDRSGTEHGFVSLVPQGLGLRAIWLDGHNVMPGMEEGTADMTLHTRFIAPTGTLAREVELDGRTCDCCPTNAAVAGNQILVVYRDRDEGEFRDISLVRLESGRWTTPAPVHRDGWKIQGCPVNGPAIAANGDRVAVAWFTAAQDTARVLVSFSADGGRSFSAPARVDDGRPIGRAGVALLDDGTAAVTWLESDKDGAQVRARLVREGARPGTSTSIATTHDARGTGIPQVARTGDRLLFAWTEPGKRSQVRVAEAKVPKLR